MNKENGNQSLFVPIGELQVGVGYHNVHQVVGASDFVQKKIKEKYQMRCGHVPLDGFERTHVLVGEHTDATTSQLDYLSDIFGRKIAPKTVGEIKQESSKDGGQKPLVVPYIRLPEVDVSMQEKLGAKVWGLPGGMVIALKNKVEFHRMIEKAQIDDLHVPDFTIARVDDLTASAEEFRLRHVEGLYKRYDMSDYNRGLMVRAAESDGNYGAAIVKEVNGNKILMPDGKMDKFQKHDTWKGALEACQVYIKEAMNTAKEDRVVISRLIDLADSPGMSAAILDGQMLSLGWNGQLYKDGTACEGTGTYKPKNEYLKRTQVLYEEKVAGAFEKLLKQLADEKGIDFSVIRGFVNIDIMIPGHKERELQRRRDGETYFYLAESNPRITHFTDAVLTGVAAQRQRQTVNSMREIIAKDLQAEDSFTLPEYVDPRNVRDMVYQRDLDLRYGGTRIITRMLGIHNVGVIFMGDTARGRRELTNIVDKLAVKK